MSDKELERLLAGSPRIEDYVMSLLQRLQTIILQRNAE